MVEKDACERCSTRPTRARSLALHPLFSGAAARTALNRGQLDQGGGGVQQLTAQLTAAGDYAADVTLHGARLRGVGGAFHGHAAAQ